MRRRGRRRESRRGREMKTMEKTQGRSRRSRGRALRHILGNDKRDLNL